MKTEKSTQNGNQDISSDQLSNWLPEEKVLKLLGIGVTSAWKLRKEGVLKYAKLGSRVFYSMSAIDEYLSKQIK